MTVRTFDGVDDVIHFEPGALVALDGSLLTIAAVWKPVNLHKAGLLFVADAGLAQVFNVNPYNDGNVWYSTATGNFGTSDWDGTEGWMLHAIRNQAGVGGLRSHKYVFDSPGWTHANEAGGIAASVNPATEAWMGRFGGVGSTECLNGSLAAMGVWDVALDDTQVETLSAGLAAWAALDPVALWAFNQAATTDPVLDLTGNGADQDGLTGTTVTVGDDPAGFSFALAGGAHRHILVPGLPWRAGA